MEPLFPGLRPMDFRRVTEDSDRAVYTAQMEDDAPGAPVYSLTVTTASPGSDEKASRELDNFLQRIEIAFFLTGPDSGEEDSGEEEGGEDQESAPDFDPENEILIEPRLVRLRTLEGGTFGVTMVMATTVATDDPQPTEKKTPAQAEEQPDVVAQLATNQLVTPARDHVYRAIGGPMTGTATSHTGTGTLSGKRFGIQSATGSSLVVHSVTPSCYYLFVGKFKGPL
jgi:hypothetical protein